MTAPQIVRSLVAGRRSSMTSAPVRPSCVGFEHAELVAHVESLLQPLSLDQAALKAGEELAAKSKSAFAYGYDAGVRHCEGKAKQLLEAMDRLRHLD